MLTRIILFSEKVIYRDFLYHFLSNAFLVFQVMKQKFFLWFTEIKKSAKSTLQKRSLPSFFVHVSLAQTNLNRNYSNIPPDHY